jgi:DNA polymerase-3 subunit delta'
MKAALTAAAEDADPAEIEALVRVGEGSPGRALAFRGLKVEALDTAMNQLATEGDATNARRSRLAAELARNRPRPATKPFSRARRPSSPPRRAAAPARLWPRR